ncbi:MAG: hypothetical protein HYU67_07700 [Flavobacteriia bacterium]|nr:hypothetical protein [Flavobacteriia bacterium]
MKNFYSFISFFLIIHSSFAQTYGNEWINYDQKYYSFKIFNDGIYKIDYQTLVNNHINTSSFSSANIQIFGREKEIPLYINDGGDNQINADGDYILFYAKKNDSWLDSSLFRNPIDIGNPGVSLFNDTINYFFTWNNSSNNSRFVIEQSNNYSIYDYVSPYCMDELLITPSTSYNPGKVSYYDPSSLFDPGEGYRIVQGEGGDTYYSYPYTFDLSQIYTGSDAPEASFQCKTTSDNKANLDFNQDFHHHLRLKFGSTILEDTNFAEYKHIIFDTTLNTTFLQNNNTFYFEIPNEMGVDPDYQSLNYVSLKYPKKTNLGGSAFDRFKIINNPPNSPSFTIHLNITGSNINSAVCMVFGAINKFINTVKINDTIHALVTNSMNGQAQEFVIYDESLIQSISLINAVNVTGKFTDFSSINYEEANLIITHPFFNSDQNIQANSKYIAYRQQSYNVVDANIEELYLQFGGGIQKHSNAIRRFAHYAYNHSTLKPIAITILGKGLSNDICKYNANNFALNYIPPFGSPGSDMFYTSFLEGSTYEPLIPIGRVSVITENDLNEYLLKLIDYEYDQINLPYTSEARDWQKQVLHFVGGSDSPQVEHFVDLLDNCKQTIEDVYFGGNVTTFKKFTTDPLDPSLLDEISNYLEYGSSIVTFFGHSGVTGFDITVDEPVNWNNYRKYPIIFGNGCHAGAIYTNPYEIYFGEKTVVAPSRGAIAYFASGGQEFDVPLKNYMCSIYSQISQINYGKYLGLQIKEAAKQIALSGISNQNSFHSTLGATNLNGDPLIMVNNLDKPEIELLENNVSFNPQEINLSVDSFDLNIIVNNIGKSIADTFMMEIVRDFPQTTSDSSYFFFLSNLNYKDTISIKMPLLPNIGMGINNFSIKVDIPSEIEEQFDESINNQVNKVFFLKLNGILPVLPYDFAVVPYDTIRVIASTTNPIASINTYFFEMDTTDLFNSPFLRKKTVIGPGGAKSVNYNEWNLATSGQNSPVICTDSTVYFWRVAIDSSILDWKESSFQYIINKEGWGQDHFFQFKKNDFQSINYNRDLRQRKFNPNEGELIVKNFDLPQSSFERATTSYSINGYRDYAGCGTSPSIHVAVFDPVTLMSWNTNCNADENTPFVHSFDQANDDCACRQRPEGFFIFRQTEEQLDLLYNMLQSIPNDHYVLVYTYYNPVFENWTQYKPELYTWFQNNGSQQIHQNADNRAFIFFTKLDDTSYFEEKMAVDEHELITLVKPIQGTIYAGNETSPLIGPSTEWKTIYWKQDPSEQTLGDTTTLVVTGYNFFTNNTQSFEYDFTSNDSILNFNNLMNASNYPYMKLQAKYYDKINETPAQVDRWHVLYSPVPEAAIDNTNAYTLSPQLDTINEGQEFIFAADYKNISTVHMDSMLVKYWIEDANHNRHYINYPRQDSLKVSQTFRDTITVNTTGFAGLNSLWMEINPYINAEQTVQDQLEQHHFNNILQIPFYVSGDDENPILDVTFDGRHILNGDIVNPKAEIYISLKDDNPYLVMDDVSDTTLFGVYLTGPDGVQNKIPFMDNNGNVIMQWLPADAQNKKFKIIYNGKFEKDGVYKLLVQGSDRSGNLSGDLEYRITFEVINESSITYLMNYPNPFSTSTRFVFTLTGSEVPEDIIIQIMTITGKVVREITEDEIGPIYIGRNITAYSWNGTDEFGDPLANGVYLYRVLSRINGEEIKHRSTGADQYFKKEFGKMYLMR